MLSNRHGHGLISLGQLERFLGGLKTGTTADGALEEPRGSGGA